MLLVGCAGSRLSIYDSWSGNLVCMWDPDYHTIYDSIACSPNGRLLTTIDMRGCLRIWDFDSLALLYQVHTRSAAFRRLEFTSDGHAIVGISETSLQVWSPPVLARKTRDGSHNRNSLNSSIATKLPSHLGIKITVIPAHPTWAVVFAGTNYGVVLAFDVKTGQKHEI